MQQKLFSLVVILSFSFVFMNKVTAQIPPPCGLSEISVCEEDGDGFATFDLVRIFPFPFCFSPDLADQYYPAKFYESESDAQNDTNAIINPENYINTTAYSQELWFRGEKINPGTGTTPDIIYKNDFIAVDLRPTISAPLPFYACDSESSGFATFNLASKRTEILSGQTGYTVYFHETYEDAINLQNIIDISYTNTVPNQQTIYASVSIDYALFEDNCVEVVALDLIVDDNCDDVSVELIRTSESPRPGFFYVNRLYITNEGLTTVDSGTVEFVYDNSLQYQSVNLLNSGASIELTLNGFNLNFTDLDPGESFYILIYLIVSETTPLGTEITSSASYVAAENDINPENNTSLLTSVVIGSYDPNDKMESHGPQVVYDDFIASDEYLYYTIRFQNIGTAEAIFVRIEDELDAQLDESTFQMLRSSHGYDIERVGAHLEWNFENINLPAEQDDAEGSNGFVYFKIKPKSGYIIDDVIPNAAAIYFDFNAPIITNTFETEFIAVETLTVKPAIVTDFKMYPNPAKNHVKITLNAFVDDNLKLSVYDIQGKAVNLNSVYENTWIDLDVSRLKSGLYFVHLTNKETSTTQKLIIN